MILKSQEKFGMQSEIDCSNCQLLQKCPSFSSQDRAQHFKPGKVHSVVHVLEPSSSQTDPQLGIKNKEPFHSPSRASERMHPSKWKPPGAVLLEPSFLWP